MAQLVCVSTVAAVAVIYLFWRSYLSGFLERRRQLRERIAFMLWVMADAEDPPFGGKRSPEVDTASDVA